MHWKTAFTDHNDERNTAVDITDSHAGETVQYMSGHLVKNLNMHAKAELSILVYYIRCAFLSRLMAAHFGLFLTMEPT